MPRRCPVCSARTWPTASTDIPAPTAAGVEEVFSSTNAWDYILSEKPTLKEKVLSFFRQSARDYSMDEGLSKSSRKLLRTYKKLFDQLSAYNRGNNAQDGIKKAVTSMNDENMQVTGENDLNMWHALTKRIDSNRKNNDNSIENYTEKEYNDYGWARANDVLSAGQNADYRTKFAQALHNPKSFPKTKQSEYMIAVSDIYDQTTEGINNAIVFAKGTIENPVITRVLEIYEYEETKLDEIRRDLYEVERRGIQQQTGGVFKRYNRSDFGDYVDAQRSVRESKRYNDRLGTDRGTGGRKATRTKGIGRNEKGHIIYYHDESYRYALPKDLDKSSGSARKSAVVYTEKQYNSFGWARYAEAISSSELDDMYSKIQEKGSLRRFRRSANDEAIIEVNDKPYTTLGVDNVFVFVKGSKNSPYITRVIRVSLYSETDMEKVRKYIYAREKGNSNSRASIIVRNLLEEDGLFGEYRREYFDSYQEYRTQVGERGIGSEGEGDSRTDRDGDQRTGTFEEDFSNVRYALPNDPENSDGSSAPFDAEAVIARGVPRTSGRMNITVGELARMEANYTKQKVYSKKDALSVVNQFAGVSDLTQKTRTEIADAV